jgi:hypothetical protein
MLGGGRSEEATTFTVNVTPDHLPVRFNSQL